MVLKPMAVAMDGSVTVVLSPDGMALCSAAVVVAALVTKDIQLGKVDTSKKSMAVTAQEQANLAKRILSGEITDGVDSVDGTSRLQLKRMATYGMFSVAVSS